MLTDATRGAAWQQAAPELRAWL